MSKICAFFGHRDFPEELEPRLRRTIEHVIEHYGVTEFYNGGYGGFDRMAEHVVHSLKIKYPQIKNTLVYAYPTEQPLRQTFDRAIYPKHLGDYPDLWHIPRRNLWMAEQSSVMITYVEHAQSRIHEPLDHMMGEKQIFNLGTYYPVKQGK